jgi:uncharacterized coiled-coil protein SlyX
MEQESLIKVIETLNATITQLNLKIELQEELIKELHDSNEGYRVALAETQINKYGEHDE